jgi:hypothetical protein
MLQGRTKNIVIAPLKLRGFFFLAIIFYVQENNYIFLTVQGELRCTQYESASGSIHLFLANIFFKIEKFNIHLCMTLVRQETLTKKLTACTDCIVSGIKASGRPTET